MPVGPSHACPSFHPTALSRRLALKLGGAGLLGLSFSQLLKAAEEQPKQVKARAKSVIFLFQWGGPSHIDMFDMKPDAPEGIRSPHKTVGSNADGITISEKLPKTAKIMEKGDAGPFGVSQHEESQLGGLL